MFAKCKSLRGNTCCQIYTTPFHFVFARPMRSKKDAHLTLDELFQKVGIPNTIIPDNAKELTEGEFRKKCNKAQCRLRSIEAYTPNANIAEGVTRELKRTYRHTMTAKNVPEILWDRCIEWCAKVRSLTALNLRILDGQVPETMMTGDTADLSHMAEFGFFDYVLSLIHI